MTTSLTTYNPGNVVKVCIRFTTGSETKRRPAVILTGDDYHNSRADAIVVAVSSQVENSYYGDYIFSDWRVAGLPKPCKAKGVIETIDRSTIEGTYGNLSDQDFQQLKICLRSMLGLDT
jgi:mRNA interferase MazF